MLRTNENQFNYLFAKSEHRFKKQDTVLFHLDTISCIWRLFQNLGTRFFEASLIFRNSAIYVVRIVLILTFTCSPLISMPNSVVHIVISTFCVPYFSELLTNLIDFLPITRLQPFQHTNEKIEQCSTGKWTGRFTRSTRDHVRWIHVVWSLWSVHLIPVNAVETYMYKNGRGSI